ncbi:MAG: metalloregulator ArsR/SmtB family transcription factor [Phycisphaerae bacterium]|nr:winged helix-turn-helix transcriptional regulator [Phycisphaerales bacterium]
MRCRMKDGLCEIDSIDSASVEETRAALPTRTVLEQVAEALKVLAHPNRLRVLEALDGRELCVCDLTAALDVSMSTLSQQLRELRRLGAIGYRVSGKFAYYSLADRFWLELARSVMSHIFDSGSNTGAAGSVRSAAR